MVQSIYSSELPSAAAWRFSWRLDRANARLAMGVLPPLVSRSAPGVTGLCAAREAARKHGSADAMESGNRNWKASSVPSRCSFSTVAMRFSLSPRTTRHLGPSFFVRVHHLSLGVVGVAAGLISSWWHPCDGPGRLPLRRFSQRFAGGRMAFTACAAAFSIPLWLAVLFANNLTVIVTATSFSTSCADMGWSATPKSMTSPAPGCAPRHRYLLFDREHRRLWIGAPLIGRISDILGVAKHADQMRSHSWSAQSPCAGATLCGWEAGPEPGVITI